MDGLITGLVERWKEGGWREGGLMFTLAILLFFGLAIELSVIQVLFFDLWLVARGGTPRPF